MKQASKDYHKEYRKKNRKSLNAKILSYYKKFPWKKTLVVIKQRCNNPNNKSYKDYGAKGIRCYLSEDDCETLYLRDKAYLMKYPTIDRLNHKGDYTLDNCRYIEKGQNSAERNKRVSSKPVLQYSLEGKPIAEYCSASEAGRKLNMNNTYISHCCTGLQKTAYGFLWRYKK